MRSVRMDRDLEQRVERAAKRRGINVSEFIRQAVRREADSELETPSSSDQSEDWRSWMKGPYADYWIKVFEKVGFFDGSDDNLDDWARNILERNFRE